MVRKLTFLLCLGLGAVAFTASPAFAASYDVRIATAMDDIEEYVATGGMSGTSTDLEMPYEDSISASQEQIVGLRWALPAGKGALITKAYVEFTYDETEVAGEVHLIIQGELAPNAAAFATTAFNLSSRTRTQAQVKWTPEAWTASGQKSKTPDLSAIIQEIVNQAGWAPGNAIVLLITDDKSNPSKATRVAAAFEDIASNGFPADAPALLHVEVSNAPAGAPSPADAATDVLRDATLRWTAGQYAATHDVYFGTDLASVSSASRTNPTGVLVSQGQTAAQYDPAGVFAYGQTYYWRVDEVNAAPSNTIVKGGVWSFTVEPFAYPITGVTATASSSQANMGPEKTIDGSGLTGDLHGTDGTTMWLSTGVLPNWIQYQFDRVYKVYDLKVWNSNQMIEAFIGFGTKNVTIETSTDGTTWTALANVPEFARATGMAGYAANTTVSFAGVMAKYVKLTINTTWGGLTAAGLSEVRFSYVPVQARGPQPANAATGVAVDTSLSWRPGREAGSHKVFLGTDQAAVAGGTATAKTVTDPSFTPSGLAFGTTYYWRVDEVNTVTYPGVVWSFTTEPFAIVDDFESYNDTSNRIYDTWIDGLTDGKSGSQVGYNSAPFAELTIFHGGKQSMPFLYNNTGAVTTSEATRTFAPAQDWTRGGAKTLVLFVYGDAANTGGQLYVKINGTKVVFTGSSAITTPGWAQWNIDLAATGVNLKSVKTLTLGVEGSGKGKLLFDDLLLYANAPAVPVGAALDVKLATVTDDMEEYIGTGAIQTTSSDLEMPYEDTVGTNEQLIGLRYFLALPKGAKIGNASVEFTCDETKGANGALPVNLIIEGQLIANAPPFLSTTKDISNRTTRTKAQVKWAVENWTTVGQKSKTPDLSPIILELINQSGWASGNAIVLIFRDDKSNPSKGIRGADAMEDQNNGAGTAPVLHLQLLP